MSRFSLAQIIAVGVLIGCAGFEPGRAEVILGPAPGNVPYQQYYYRFSNAYPDDPTQTANDTTFYLNNVDFSGVGWKLPGVLGTDSGTAWNVAMIDSTHFVGAYHVAALGDLSVGNTLNFRPSGSTSAIVTGTVANLQNVPNPDGSKSDVLLGTLSAPLPSSIATYLIAPAAAYPQVMYVYGRSSEVGQSNADFTQSGIPFQIDGNPADNETLNGLFYSYNQPGGTPDPTMPSTVGNNESHLEEGDSGGPSFLLVGGKLQLVGTHAAVASYEDIGQSVPPGVTDDTAYSIDSYLPDYAAEIEAMIAVPEPSSLALCAFTAVGALGGFIRSRRRRPTAA